MSSVLSHGQLTVPPGLPAALESLARAVLKEQPDDLPKFAAMHFHLLLTQRERKLRAYSITSQYISKIQAISPLSCHNVPWQNIIYLDNFFFAFCTR